MPVLLLQIFFSIALRKAKIMYTIVACLSAIGLNACFLEGCMVAGRGLGLEFGVSNLIISSSILPLLK